MQLEERRRVTYLCFVADTQASMLHSRSASMSVSDLRLSLPCCPASWEAESAGQWREIIALEPTEPSLFSLLQDYQQPELATWPKALNALSHILVLYGLVAISMETIRRKRTIVDCNPATGQMRPENPLMPSMRTWKVKFDAYTTDVRGSLRENGLARELILDYRFHAFVSDATVLYYAASAFLHLGICDLDGLADGPDLHLSFNPQQTMPCANLWLSDQSAGQAARHAGHAIRKVVLDSCMNSISGLFSPALSLYISLLVCCTFHLQQRTPLVSFSGQYSSSLSNSGASYDIKESWHAARQMGLALLALTDMNSEHSPITISRDQVKALCAGVRDHLRWIHSPRLESRAEALERAFCK